MEKFEFKEIDYNDTELRIHVLEGQLRDARWEIDELQEDVYAHEWEFRKLQLEMRKVKEENERLRGLLDNA